MEIAIKHSILFHENPSSASTKQNKSINMNNAGRIIKAMILMYSPDHVDFFSFRRELIIEKHI